MNFKQFLEEGRDAPLYHATEFNQAFWIVATDQIKPLTVSKGPAGTSLTRDIRFAKSWHKNGVIFEFSQRKLSQRYKIEPVNYYASDKNTSNKAEREEFLIGKVRPMRKYINRIIINSKYIDQYDKWHFKDFLKILDDDKIRYEYEKF
jgi:hypothetical protein